MSVLLIDNILFNQDGAISKSSIWPHLGLMSLVAQLGNQHIQAEIFDPKYFIINEEVKLDSSIYRNLAKLICQKHKSIVGFTSFGCNFLCTQSIALEIKKINPKINIILGGPHASILDKEILENFSQFDIIVRKEADESFPILVKAILENSNFSEIRGISFINNGVFVRNPDAHMVSDLNKLNQLDYAVYPIKEFGLDSLPIDAGRGCPFDCTFCSTAPFFGRRFRIKTVERIVSEMQNLRKQFGINKFELTHDLFTVNRKYIVEFCNQIKDLKFSWRCSARIDCVDSELLELMFNAGCDVIFYGIETGSSRMQEIIKKKLDLSQYKEIIGKSLELGMHTRISFITGYPEERIEDQLESINLIGWALGHSSNTKLEYHLHILAPEPGTQIYNENKSVLLLDEYISDQNFPYLCEADKETVEKHPEIFMTNFHFPTILDRKEIIFMSEVIKLLGKFDRHYLNYVLKEFNCSLSDFLLDIWKVNKNEIQKSMNNLMNIFERTLKTKFGENHFLFSICRYYQAISFLRKIRYKHIKFDETSNLSTDSNNTIIGKKMILLKKIHNCEKLIQFISKNQSIPIPLASEEINILLKIQDNELKIFYVSDQFIEKAFESKKEFVVEYFIEHFLTKQAIC